jgi:ribulose-5-phosphate 4-epimerase/fuculose-1-phosphate aldolase
MNKREKMPKKEYFKMRLSNAIEDGRQDKADYYRSRLAELSKDVPSKKERITLKEAGMFGSRDTLQEAFDYAEMMSKSMESAIHAITPVYVLYNTIAKQYDLVPKAK